MKTFFILSLGRSGTMTLSKALDLASGALVRHEPWSADRHTLFYRYAGGFDTVVDGMLRDRFEALLPRDPAVSHYGEANSYLRYEATWLRTVLGAQTFFVVRDGRDFIRSAYRRRVLTALDPQQPIVPRDVDATATLWAGMSRFERLCWYWRHTNEMLLATHRRPLRMEDLVRSYSCFRDEFLVPLGLELEEASWRRVMSSRLNASPASEALTAAKGLVRQVLSGWGAPPTSTLAGWAEWPDDLTEQFWCICGDVMARLGYQP